jgi:predicted transcriptional regulator
MVLVEIATRQPEVEQADIAKKLSIKGQAVSEHIKGLIEEGYVEKDELHDYRITHKGAEELLRMGRVLNELRETSVSKSGIDELKVYFSNVKGHGVLATADAGGKVDVAVYAKPHFMDEQMIAFIMGDRLTRHNLQSNPHAAYLFMEDGGGFVGVRLFLTKTKEEKDSKLLYSIRRRKYEGDEKESKYLVFFQIDQVLPLIGDDERSLPFKA